MKRMARKGGAIIGPAFSVRIGENEFVVAGPSLSALWEAWGRLCPNAVFTPEMARQVAIVEAKEG